MLWWSIYEMRLLCSGGRLPARTGEATGYTLLNRRAGNWTCSRFPTVMHLAITLR